MKDKKNVSLRFSVNFQAITWELDFFLKKTHYFNLYYGKFKILSIICEAYFYLYFIELIVSLGRSFHDKFHPVLCL